MLLAQGLVPPHLHMLTFLRLSSLPPKPMRGPVNTSSHAHSSDNRYFRTGNDGVAHRVQLAHVGVFDRRLVCAEDISTQLISRDVSLPTFQWRGA
jgi:hypothetical protein